MNVLIINYKKFMPARAGETPNCNIIIMICIILLQIPLNFPSFPFKKKTLCKLYINDNLLYIILFSGLFICKSVVYVYLKIKNIKKIIIKK